MKSNTYPDTLYQKISKVVDHVAKVTSHRWSLTEEKRRDVIQDLWVTALKAKVSGSKKSLEDPEMVLYVAQACHYAAPNAAVRYASGFKRVKGPVYTESFDEFNWKSVDARTSTSSYEDEVVRRIDLQKIKTIAEKEANELGYTYVFEALGTGITDTAKAHRLTRGQLVGQVRFLTKRVARKIKRRNGNL